ncbi:type II toxin-antitoxin system HipA family toxin [Amantichitinum ursilacus]|uniref:Serine/threonine-protein kinase HipA n=1 Tax=Amantichitinum ursilacus TaxID=857265 RepID=A0A0N0GP99_9NEIS|nr:type II toxin-antitoxin system HipA family toxin [Amantichitinum ursilacus]KPC53284.1 Serine/threonine-protein kinase HipA [Amantichitinum ursilacus]
MPTLSVWMNGLRVGFWSTTAQGDEFAYDANWLSDQNGQRRPISLSMKFRPGHQPHKGALVRNYFDNLLPDSENIRRRLAAQHSLAGIGTFELLEAIGRDCVGALQLLPEDGAPKDLIDIKGEPLDEAGVARVVRRTLSDSPAALRDDAEELRISIAGAQEKTALLFHEGRWQKPVGSTPSTHILKLPMGEILVNDGSLDMRHSVENEWLCGRVLHAYGLDIADSEILCFEDQKVLAVKRFDRRMAADHKWIIRLPQEDFCQALGISSVNKYASNGGPRAEDINALLIVSAGENDRRTFFCTLVIFWMLAAIDGHAKNFSVFLQANSKYQLTPLYDVLSAHPIIGGGRGQYHESKVRLAMPVQGKSGPHYLISRIQARHWIYFGAKVLQFTQDEATIRQLLQQLVDQTEPAIAQVEAQLPASFPEQVSDSIFAGLRKYARKLESGLNAQRADADDD